MKQYLDLCKKVLSKGLLKENRTDVKHIGYTGDMMQFNLQYGFPAVTTKKLAFKSVIGEMLGFLRGYTSAEDFRKLGCDVWNANANNNDNWLSNINRKGKDDLGRIYGAQGRRWRGKTYLVDQLQMVYEDLKRGIDNRREIVTHWNPSEMDLMALPPCHLLYQFGIQGNYLNLSLYQRSCDVPLGIPFNIAGYAWLLSVMAHITGFKAGEFTHFMHDIHMYENQLYLMKYVQLQRKPFPLPKLIINKNIKTLQDLETWVTPEDFTLADYQCHAKIYYPFTV